MNCTEKCIIDLLIAHTCKFPDKTAYLLVGHSVENDRRVSYSELGTAVAALAGSLTGKDLKGRTAVLLYQDNLEFIISFLACQYAGIIPVPLPYTKRGRQQAKWAAVIEDTQAAAVLCADHSMDDLGRWIASQPYNGKLTLIATSFASLPLHAVAAFPPSCAETAFIQYTSGSTGNPRGVVVTHKSLLDNQQLIQETFGCNEASVIFSWLPFHHDMGLIGNIIHAIYTGCTCVLLSPYDFMQKPLRWLQGMSAYKATHSGGPNFAYDMCMENISTDELSCLDLSSWTVAYNGAEPVSPATLHRFGRYFEPAGFKKESFYPCYGLAEATLLVSGCKTGLIPRTLSRDDKEVVSCGRAPAGMHIKIINPHTGSECIGSQEGEICISGKSVTAGYWNRDNTEFFYTIGNENWLRTGDLGILHEAELFVTGRIKEMLIIRGRNYYPYDIEQAAAAAHPSVRANSVAVFSLSDNDSDFAILAEIKRAALTEQGLEEVAGAIHSAISDIFGIIPSDVVLTTPMGIPRTTSGKLQRVQCRDAYHAGALQVVTSKKALSRPSPAEETGPSRILPSPDRNDDQTIANYLRGLLSKMPGTLPIAPQDDKIVLTALGIDSLRATELVNRINMELGIAIDVAFLIGDHTLKDLIRLIADRLWIKNGSIQGNELVL